MVVEYLRVMLHTATRPGHCKPDWMHAPSVSVVSRENRSKQFLGATPLPFPSNATKWVPNRQTILAFLKVPIRRLLSAGEQKRQSHVEKRLKICASIED